jgi:hypothetical protein
MVNIRILCLSLLFFQFLSLPAFAAQVRAVADRDRLALGESLQLELRVEGSADGDPDFSALEKDWEILGQSHSSQISIVNGDFNRSVVYSLTLMPRREGELTIPAVCFGGDCSSPLPIRVAATATGPSAAENARVLVEAEADADKVVSQGQLLLTVRLLHRVDLLQGSLSEPEPAGVDAALQKLGEDRKYETRRAGRLYGVIERKYAIFPQMPGTLRIPPLRFDGIMAGASSRFDPFGRQGERTRQYSKPLEIQVLPPAKDVGTRPWLPARALRLQDDWQGKTLHLTVGEPATRTLTVTAEGLQAAQLPELKVETPQGFKSYPDQPSRQDKADGQGVTGILQQKIALVATRPGRYRLPAMDLDWWDVAAGQWQRDHLDPVNIEVAPAPGTLAAAPAAGTPPAEQQTRENEAPATPGPIRAESAPPPHVPSAGPASYWPWLSLALGVGWLGTLVLLLKERTKRPRPTSAPAEENPRQREKAARKAVIQAAGSNDARATRTALTAWIGTLWPEADRAGLDRLRQTAPDALGRELERLDRALFSPTGENWTGKALIEALGDWQGPSPDRKMTDRLPGLYPK